ncbi:MAG: hypothetical protein RLW61_22450 [Gammaproteobacteria bacterium]
MNAPQLHLVADAPVPAPSTATEGRRTAFGARVSGALGALRSAARAGMARSVCACEALCEQIEATCADDPATACILLECVAREPAAQVLRPRLFAIASRLANADNPFIVYRACAQALALGRHDLRLDNHAGVLVGTIRAQARPVLARRLGRLVEQGR